MNAPERRVTGVRPVAAITAAGAVLLVLSGSTRNGWLVLLAGLGFGLLAAALVLRPRLDGLVVDVALPPRATSGDVVTAAVLVTNDGPRSTPAATVRLSAPGLADASLTVPALPRGASARAEVPVPTTARAALTSITATTSSAAPFGVLTVSVVTESPAHLLIRPAPEQPMHHVPGGRGEGSEQTRPAPGVDVQGIREWRAGDSAARLHVRSTARHGRPIVLDRHDDLSTGVAVVLGGGGAPDHPLWEALVAVVAATLADAARSGHRIAATTDQPLLPDLSTGGVDDALDWCARVTVPGPPTPEAVRRAAAGIGTGGSVVVADLLWSERSPWWPACVAAAHASEVDLLVLHPFTGRTDALCLHGSNAAAHPMPSGTP